MSIPGLRHPDAEVRRQHVAALGGPDVDRQRTALLELLDDPDWRVRREAAQAIARGDRASIVIDPLLDGVERGDVARRNAAMEALRSIGPSVGPGVLERLRRTQGAARRFFVEVLADVGDPSAVSDLERLLDADDPNVTHAAAEALARIAGPDAEAALLRAADSPEAVVRLAVLQAFTGRQRSIPWERLRALLDDSICRRTALIAAGFAPASAARDELLRALRGGGPHASAAALGLSSRIALGRDGALRDVLRAESAAPEVLAGLAVRGSAEVRAAALRCLGLLGARSTIGQVLRAIDDPETAKEAESALEAFGQDAVAVAVERGPELGRGGVLALLRWVPRFDCGEYAAALVALAEPLLDGGGRSVVLWNTVAAWGDRAAVRRLFERIVSRAAALDPQDVSHAIDAGLERFPDLAPTLSILGPHTPVGVVAATALARVGVLVDESALRDALSSPSAAVRAGALRALDAAGSEACEAALLAGLSDEDPAVQSAAASLLGARGSGREVLLGALGSADPRVRRSAIAAVARWPDGLDRVSPSLEDPDPSVVLSAMAALSGRLSPTELESLCFHGDFDVASEALSRLRTKDAARAAALAERLLDHPSWAVRIEAVRALSSRGTESEPRLLAARAVERDELVFEAIERALAELGERR
jgi:HEAT repeat protein